MAHALPARTALADSAALGEIARLRKKALDHNIIVVPPAADARRWLRLEQAHPIIAADVDALAGRAAPRACGSITTARQNAWQ